METVDCLVIGAGVVGLAIARALAVRGQDVLVLEREVAFGTVTSARNSEVIHAGLYYADGSLKARLCTEGRARIYAFCENHGVPHQRCGKLIVATKPDQREALDAIRRSAHCNGVTSLEWRTASQVQRMEPALHCCDALLSPETGIIDSHAFMLALLGEAEDHGANLVCRTTVSRVVRYKSAFAVFINGEEVPSLNARCIVNAAGLDAANVAQRIEGLSSADIPPMWFAKGNYFRLMTRAPVARLVYPVPEQGGLGIHLTLDLSGRARFGPDVEWVEQPDYAVDRGRAMRFAETIRTYWPSLPVDALAPDYAGVRPKLVPPGQPAADFRIDGAGEHGVDGLINLFGIESPGLTASLALADLVADKLLRD